MTDLKLYEVSVVTFPAYSASTAGTSVPRSTPRPAARRRFKDRDEWLTYLRRTA